jgi:toxin ParE1/3/4
LKLLKVVFSPQALQDLDEIWEYSFANWGLEKAESYTNEIRTAVTRLTQFPGRGRLCDFIRNGYRRLDHGSHTIFYICADASVDVMRILHQSVDFDRHL